MKAKDETDKFWLNFQIAKLTLNKYYTHCWERSKLRQDDDKTRQDKTRRDEMIY